MIFSFYIACGSHIVKICIYCSHITCCLHLEGSCFCKLFVLHEVWMLMERTHHCQINWSIVHRGADWLHFYITYGSTCGILLCAVFGLHTAQTLLNLSSAFLCCIWLAFFRILVLLFQMAYGLHIRKSWVCCFYILLCRILALLFVNFTQQAPCRMLNLLFLHCILFASCGIFLLLFVLYMWLAHCKILIKIFTLHKDLNLKNPDFCTLYIAETCFCWLQVAYSSHQVGSFLWYFLHSIWLATCWILVFAVFFCDSNLQWLD